MTTAFDSFDESPLGVFVESPLGVRNSTGKILVWGTNSQAPFVGIENAKSVYESAGIAVADHEDWSNSISDYSLIIWALANSDPSWMPMVRNSIWRGRLLICADSAPLFNSSILYCQSLAGMHGMSVVGGDYSRGLTGWNAVLRNHPLNEGVTVLRYGATSLVSGGRPIAGLVDIPNATWIAETYRNGIQWILSGDSTLLYTGQSPGQNFSELNTKWLLNLASVPLPSE
jgi:hypothetical protein